MCYLMVGRCKWHHSVPALPQPVTQSRRGEVLRHAHIPAAAERHFPSNPHYCMAAFQPSPGLCDYKAIKPPITLEGWGARWQRSRLLPATSRIHKAERGDRLTANVFPCGNSMAAAAVRNRDDVEFPQAGPTCSTESCFSAADALASRPFLMCSSASRLSVFSPSSLVSLAHSWRSLASSAFCLRREEKTEKESGPQKNQLPGLVRTRLGIPSHCIQC